MEPISVIIWLWLSWGVTSMLLDKGEAAQESDDKAAGTGGDEQDNTEAVRRNLRERLDANTEDARQTDWGNPGWWLRALLGAAWKPVTDVRRGGQWVRDRFDRDDDTSGDTAQASDDDRRDDGQDDGRNDGDRHADDQRAQDQDDQRGGDQREADDRSDEDDGREDDERPGAERGEDDQASDDDDDDDDDASAYWRRWWQRRRRSRADEHDGADHDGDQGEDYEVEVVGTYPNRDSDPRALRPAVRELTAPQDGEARPEESYDDLPDRSDDHPDDRRGAGELPAPKHTVRDDYTVLWGRWRMRRHVEVERAAAEAEADAAPIAPIEVGPARRPRCRIPAAEPSRRPLPRVTLRRRCRPSFHRARPGRWPP
ncbi:hypothetical protein ACFQ0B_81855 [Nonomuraea thailandensis]